MAYGAIAAIMVNGPLDLAAPPELPTRRRRTTSSGPPAETTADLYRSLPYRVKNRCSIRLTFVGCSRFGMWAAPSMTADVACEMNSARATERHFSADGSVASDSLEIRVIRLNKPELCIEAVGISRMQGPTETGTRTAVDHDTHELLTQSMTAVGVHNVGVREVSERDSIGNGAGEADHPTIAGHVVNTHHSPS